MSAASSGIAFCEVPCSQHGFYVLEHVACVLSSFTEEFSLQATAMLALQAEGKPILTEK